MIDALASPLVESSWVDPGPAQLVLGGESVQAIEGTAPLEVDVLEEQGSDVRVGIRLPHARFALWMSRARLFGILARDERIAPRVAAAGSAGRPEVVLRGGARVTRLARKDGRVQIRYVGALEVEAWVPDEAVTDRGAAGRKRHGRLPGRGKALMVIQGAVIRSEPRWAGHVLAVVNEGHFVDAVKQLDDAWYEIGYEDGDVRVHGFLSKRDPPGRTHRRRPAEAAPPISANASVPDGACLHAGNEEVGFLVGDQQVRVDRAGRPGWFVVTIDTPWGPLAFDARGAAETELAKCGE